MEDYTLRMIRTLKATFLRIGVGVNYVEDTFNAFHAEYTGKALRVVGALGT